MTCESKPDSDAKVALYRITYMKDTLFAKFFYKTGCYSGVLIIFHLLRVLKCRTDHKFCGVNENFSDQMIFILGT